MKVVIDSNVIILAAIGSGTCSKVILLTIDNAQIMESKIVSIEL
jgi:predicted nucleic acid-binding protein